MFVLETPKEHSARRTTGVEINFAAIDYGIITMRWLKVKYIRVHVHCNQF